MFNESFIEKLYNTDKNLFKKFYNGVRKYINKLKDAFLETRNEVPFIVNELDKVDSFIAEKIAQAAGETKNAPLHGYTLFNESFNKTERAKLNHIISKAREIIIAAKNSTDIQTGEIEVSPLSNESFAQSITDFGTQIPSKPVSVLDTYEITDDETGELVRGTVYNDEFQSQSKKYRASIRKIFSPLFNAINNRNYSDNVLAQAMAVTRQSKTLDELNAMSLNEKRALVKDAIKKLDSDLSDNYKEVISNRISTTDELPDFVKSTVIHAVNLDEKSAINEISAINNSIYKENGVPNITDSDILSELSGETFYGKVLRSNILKSLAGLDKKNSNELQNALRFFENLTNAKNNIQTFEDLLKESTDNIQKEIATSAPVLQMTDNMLNVNSNGSKDWFRNTFDVLSNFANTHLSFGSLLEVLSPNNESSAIQKRISELTKTKNRTQEQEQELYKLKTSVIGKGATPAFQKITDSIQDAFFQINDDNFQLTENLGNDVAKAFGLKSNSSIKKKLYDILTENTITLEKADGKKVKITESQAALILNISEMGVYNESLEKEGIDDTTITTLKNNISPEVNTLRNILKKKIKSEIEKTKKEYEKMYGFAPATPVDGFFPVPFKNKTIAQINSYDISLNTGNIDNTFDEITGESSREIDLDLLGGGNNLITMYNFFMLNSIYRRNMTAPLTVAKTVLTDSKITDTIDNSFGKSFRETLFRHLSAFETNGIRDTTFNSVVSNRIRKMTVAAARGIMGYNLRTILINLTSAFNTFLDASIPTSVAFRATFKALSGWSTRRGSKEIQQRINAGANALVNLSKNRDAIDRPGMFSTIAEYSLEPMSQADALGGTLAANIAYHAHYEMAKKAKLSDADAEIAANEGMRRTILKTFQPTTLAGKSSIELTNNPILKVITLFTSETRKNLGLEIAEFKKQKGLGKVFNKTVFTNHVLFGLFTWMIRASVSDWMKPEDEDEDIYNTNKLMMDILLGPLSGLFMVGGGITELGYSAMNKFLDLFDEDQKKIPIFGSDNVIISSVKGGADSVKIFEDLNALGEEDFSEDSIGDFIDTFNKSVNSLSTLSGNSTLTGVTNITKVVNQLYDIIFKEEYEKD